MKKLHLVLLSALSCLPFSLHAASFDCKKASTETEKIICASSQLSNLDDLLVTSYKKALATTDDKATLKSEQMEWLGTREACEDKDCIKTLYNERIAALNELISEAKETPQANSTTKGDEGWYKATAKPNLVVRNAPSVTGERVGTIPTGGKIKVISLTNKSDFIGGDKGEWVKVQWQNKHAYVFNAFIEKIANSDTSTNKRTLSGTISNYECGDNCYLTVTDNAGTEHSGLCTASTCDTWNENSEMPTRYLDKKVKITIGTGTQVDGSGNVMGEMDAFDKIEFLD